MVSTTRLINAGLRVFLFMFTVVSLGIEGHLRASGYNTARVNLGVAASVIGLVLSCFIPWIMLFVDAIYNVLVLLALDLCSLGIYLGASASLTVKRHMCHEPGRGKCAQFKTGFAFLYMDWIMVFFVMLLQFYQLFAEGMTGSRGSGAFDSNIRRPATGYAKEGYADQQNEPSPLSTPQPAAA